MILTQLDISFVALTSLKSGMRPSETNTDSDYY